MISHRNVIANTLQLVEFEKPQRKPNTNQTVLGLLPQSHIYGLVVICHVNIFRGDSVVILPKFDFAVMLSAIEKFKINCLYLVSQHPYPTEYHSTPSLLHQLYIC
jgi:ribosome assembly protein SQT1